MSPDARRPGPPFPGCICPPGYVRDTCDGHTDTACRFFGLFGQDLTDAHRAGEAYPAGEQLALDTTEATA